MKFSKEIRTEVFEVWSSDAECRVWCRNTEEEEDCWGRVHLCADQEKRKIMAMSACHPETIQFKFWPDMLVIFFQQNYKISKVRGRQQMLIYLDFGTAAHEIAKNGSNGPK